MCWKRVFIFALVVTFLPLLHAGQEKNDEKRALPPLRHEVVVTATRVETPAKEIGSSITVLTSRELDWRKNFTVWEALQKTVGLTAVQNGPAGGAASLSIRGGNSEHTLVLLDGVELNDPISPSRSFDAAHLLVEGIDRVEILRGPQSPLYGSDALSGIINIITQKVGGKPRFSLASSAGTYGTFANSAAFSGSSEKLNYSFGLTNFQTKGVSAASSAYAGNSEKDGYRNITLFGRIGLKISGPAEGDLAFRVVDTKTDIDNFGGPRGDDPNNVQKCGSFYLRGALRTLMLKNRWEQKLVLSLMASNRTHDNAADEFHPFDSEKGRFESRLSKIDWQNNFFIHPTNTLTFGLEYKQEEGESEYVSRGIYGPFTSLLPRVWGRTVSGYIQDQWRIKDRLFITAGMRLDRHSRAGAAWTYRVSPAYFVAATGTKFKASFGTAFKSPSLYQLFAPGTAWGPIGNSGLQPETATGLDWGLEQQLLGGKLLVEAVYFMNSYQNLITFDMLDGYINIGRARSRGVEISAEARPEENLLLKTSYIRMEAKDVDKNVALLRRPRDKFTASLDYLFHQKWSFSLQALYTGERDDVDYSQWPYPQLTLPAYFICHASVGFDFSRAVQLFARFDNIFNKKYEMVFGYGTYGFSSCAGAKVLF